MKRIGNRRFFKAFYSYLVFFLLVAFVITCCTMLFVSTLADSLEVELTNDNISKAAKLTFINVVFLSVVFTAIDGIRRKITVERPVKKITEAAEKISGGDFKVRIPLHHSVYSDDSLYDIAVCFNKMAEALEATESIQTDFIANVSHEIKTPLAVIQNYGKLLADDGIDEKKRKEYAKTVTLTSQRLAELVTNILRLNKLENQLIKPAKQKYNLGEQLCECLLYFEDGWERKQLEIETDIEEDVIVESDSELFELVWNNLFSNAIKFTEKGGKITLCLKTLGDDAIVSVSDTGCGISKEVGMRMFDKFYQGDTSHASKGNGLGLALVKRVVDMTESEISVESEVGKGTTFKVRMHRVKE